MAKPLCPRCAIGLRAATAGGVRALGCPRCGGLMLDKRSVVKMTTDPCAALLADSAAATSKGAPIDRSRTNLPCPLCRAPMKVEKAIGVDVDVCASHGTWFDRDELRQIVDRAGRRPCTGAPASPALGAALVASAALSADASPSSGRGAVKAEVAGEVSADLFEAALEAVPSIDPGLAPAVASEISWRAAEASDALVGVGERAAETALDVVGDAAGSVVAEGAGAVVESIFDALGAILSSLAP